ncbi:MAG: microcin C ABC transporter permease YejB [Proteobacteria bacterium]|jgi:microcin C transport system permease protein|nr:microcin C ABC transporter permease YejB [Pseudomonadota bacterium]MBT5228225.1 microcin C ABC transporter permease YejB [Pseudomonadota bacterium]MBT5819582.1 microcin C ABC transporter permease YejB [Pseudomonadota bacterium]MBT6349097.1 microcin C ABC transporter permease YejB [Pseudomonadota bacterium]
MTAYIVRRLLLIIPTLFAIMVINFLIIQVAPGGPVEQIISQLTGVGVDITERVTRTGTTETLSNTGGSDSFSGKYRGAQGLDPDFIAELEARFGFDKPLHVRFITMMKQYLMLDFGESFYRDRSVVDLVLDKMPVSISLGIWTTLLVYLISIPLGIAKAVRDGSRFDVWTSVLVVIGAAIPSFLFAVFLLVTFAGGSYLDWFPLAGLTSENWETLSWPSRILDYFWHITLPVLAMTIGGFATLTMLTKNSFLDQINQQYVLTARAKGLSERRVVYGHVFRNAMLIVIAGFPSAFIGILFTGSLLIEIIFSLDGLGLLGFEAAFARDYPVMFGTLFFFSLLGLVMSLLGDLTYTLVDPRIDFESRET